MQRWCCNSHVNTFIKLLAPQQLRRHPCRRACVCVRGLNVRHVSLHARQAKITHFAAEIISNQQVVALEVAVNDGRGAAVEIEHADGSVRRNLQLPLPVKVRAVGLHYVMQAAAGDEFSDDAKFGGRSAGAHEQDTVHVSDLVTCQKQRSHVTGRGHMSQAEVTCHARCITLLRMSTSRLKSRCV